MLQNVAHYSLIHQLLTSTGKSEEDTILPVVCDNMPTVESGKQQQDSITKSNNCNIKDILM